MTKTLRERIGGTYPVEKHVCGVWMVKNKRCQSVAREIAEHCMRGLKLDPSDHHNRDDIITAVAPLVEEMLNYVVHDQQKKVRFLETQLAFVKGLNAQMDKLFQTAIQEKNGRIMKLEEALKNASIEVQKFLNHENDAGGCIASIERGVNKVVNG